MPAIDTHIMIAGMHVPSSCSSVVRDLTRLRLGWLVLSSGLFVGCSGGGGASAPPSTTEEPEAVETSSSSLPMGTIEGIVRLAEGTSLPSYATNPMAMRPGASEMPPECPPPSESDRQPVQLGASGGLTNLVMVATGDPDHWPERTPPQTRIARIERCRLMPQTLVAQRGDTIHFESDLTFPFFPDLGTGFSRALLPTDPLDLVLDQGGVRTIECAFANNCGRMEVVTLYHPVFTVSDAEGRFRLANVPAGQDVRVTAWHPLFEEAAAQARVEAGATTRIELVIRPIPPPEPVPTEPQPPRDPLAGDIPE